MILNILSHLVFSALILMSARSRGAAGGARCAATWTAATSAAARPATRAIRESPAATRTNVHTITAGLLLFARISQALIAVCARQVSKATQTYSALVSFYRNRQ